MIARRCAVAACLPLLALASCVAPHGSPPEHSATAPPPRVTEQPAESPAPAHLLRLTGHIEQGGLVFGSAEPGATATLDGKPIPVASDGRFLFGFGRDAAATAALEIRYPDGGVDRRTLSVMPRAWNIQSLPTLPKGTTPTAEFLARRRIELARIAAARAKESGSEGWRQAFAWPAIGRISGVFGSQRIYAGEPGDPHSGVDIARPAGTAVAAPAEGVVVLAAEAPFTLEGNLLIIDHGMGLNSAFLHLSRIDVKEGDAVRRGQIVGAIGATGRATGPHLHWAMKWRDVRVDPQRLAGAMPAG